MSTDPYREWNAMNGRDFMLEPRPSGRWLFAVMCFAIVVAPTLCLWIANS